VDVRDDRPRAPWHPFPLVELSVLAGIVLLVLGLISSDTPRGRAMIVTGLALGSLGGLDTAAREHFAGFRSHTLVLAGVPTVVVAGVLYFLSVPWVVVLAGAVLTLAVSCRLLWQTFRRRPPLP
jgi:NADH:ubiquinone oxidoreductase subunit 5 (subunit L)/multisubunit Na+/H+ antiporter MnhA subunit